jgi:hypothetical protein
MFETLLKLATGLVLDVSKPAIMQAVGDSQYGALMSSGADKMVYNLRSLAAARPDHLFVATDIKNAFGAVLKHKAHEALLKYAPQLAPIMSLFRKPLTPPYSFPNHHTPMSSCTSLRASFRVNAYPRPFSVSSSGTSLTHSTNDSPSLVSHQVPLAHLASWSPF